jgi:RNA polymerase sigma-70 factor (ECF subfamily)
MEKNHTRNEAVSIAYKQYHLSLIGFVFSRIGNQEEAEDIIQDLYVRLLNYDQLLCMETIKSLLFTMAQNMITDHFRHKSKTPHVDSYTYDVMTKVMPITPVDQLQVDNLLEIESAFVSKLTPKCRKVYMMTRFEEKSIDEIAFELNLSRRTIERQQYLSRIEIREKMRRII